MQCICVDIQLGNESFGHMTFHTEGWKNPLITWLKNISKLLTKTKQYISPDIIYMGPESWDPGDLKKNLERD